MKPNKSWRFSATSKQVLSRFYYWAKRNPAILKIVRMHKAKD